METLPQEQYRDGSRDPVDEPRADEPLKIYGLRKLVAAGERRLEYLDEQIRGRRGSPGSLSFDKAERRYHRAAIRALLYHEAIIDADTSPIAALGDVLVELEALGLPTSATDHDRLGLLVAKARRILQALAA